MSRLKSSQRLVVCGSLSYISIVTSLLILMCVSGRTAVLVQSSKSRAKESLTIARLVGNVRKSIGYDQVKKLKSGFTVEETLTESKNKGSFVYLFGPNGELRRQASTLNPNAFVFDGKDGWLIDSRTGWPSPPFGQRAREKLLFPMWVRNNWWLNQTAPLRLSLLPEESNDKRVAISMKFRDGLVEAKLFVDRATWLPTTLVVEYESGPYTVEMKDYQETLGFLYPHQFAINYRGSTGNYKVSSITTILPTGTNPFSKPPPPNDTTFDNSRPPELRVAKGEGEEGHYYIRPLIDGRDIGWFHFDTGYGSMMIDTKFADELGMPVIDSFRTTDADGKPKTITIRRGKSFQLGRVTIKDPIYLADDLSKRNAPPGEKRAGLCGYPLFARVIAEFIQGGGRIALYDPASYKLTKGKWQKFTFVEHVPAVLARLEGNREGLFIPDTGASGTVIFNSRYSKDQNLLAGRQVKEISGMGGGRNIKLLRGSIEWFQLAGYRFQNPVAEFGVGGEGLEMEGRAGVVGRDFMAPFTIVFDYAEKRIAFIR